MVQRSLVYLVLVLVMMLLAILPASFNSIDVQRDGASVQATATGLAGFNELTDLETDAMKAIRAICPKPTEKKLGRGPAMVKEPIFEGVLGQVKEFYGWWPKHKVTLKMKCQS